MSEPAFIETDGGGLNRDEAAALAGVVGSGVWPPLQRILDAMRKDALLGVMSPKAGIDEINRERGRYSALADVEALLAESIPAAYAEAVKRLEEQAAT